MALLLDGDYVALAEWGLTWEESEPDRFFIFTALKLPEGMYTVAQADILVVVPANYNQAGNDMLWTFPRLYRRDGKAIPNVLDPGGGDNRFYRQREFCRWSRHWNPGAPGVWRPGKDGIIAIYRRVDWALRNPDC